MSEVQSFVFDFTRVKDFFDRWNVDWKTTGDFGVTNKFELVYSSYAPSNESECIGNDGKLTGDVTIHSTQDATLNWINEEVVLGSDVTFSLGANSVPCKAIFIRNKSTQVVLGYCIHINSYNLTNQLKFKEDTVFWSIQDGE